MKNLNKTLSALLISSSLLSPLLYADTATLQKRLVERMPGLTVDDIKPSKVDGLYEVLSGANIFYASDDGKYLIQGRMIDLIAKKDLTESRLGLVKADLINAVPKSELITFKAPIEKYKIYVFTDIDCGYCRKLHKELDSYLAEGISINYLFYPRAGKDSSAYDKAVSVWCADDKQAALTIAKTGKGTLETKTCVNPVEKHMALGESLGVRGTPMMITPKGTIFPGYMPAKKLAEALATD